MTTDEGGEEHDLVENAPTNSPVQTKITDCLRKELSVGCVCSTHIISKLQSHGLRDSRLRPRDRSELRSSGLLRSE